LKTFTDLISTQTIDVLQILLQELQLCGMLMAELFSGAGITTPLLQELQICRWSDEERWQWGRCLLSKKSVVVTTAAGAYGDSCWACMATATIDRVNDAHHLTSDNLKRLQEVMQKKRNIYGPTL
jgi:hypothetical protein